MGAVPAQRSPVNPGETGRSGAGADSAGLALEGYCFLSTHVVPDAHSLDILVRPGLSEDPIL